MEFHRSLCDSKSPWVSRTLLSILPDFYNAELRMISILSLISDSSSLFSKHLRTIPSVQTTISITVTLMFHHFKFGRILYSGFNWGLYVEVLAIASLPWSPQLNLILTIIIINSSICSCGGSSWSSTLVMLATVNEGDPKPPFSLGTKPRYKEGRNSFPWIVPLYPWSVPYNTECLAGRHQVPFF